MSLYHATTHDMVVRLSLVKRLPDDAGSNVLDILCVHGSYDAPAGCPITRSQYKTDLDFSEARFYHVRGHYAKTKQTKGHVAVNTLQDALIQGNDIRHELFKQLGSDKSGDIDVAMLHGCDDTARDERRTPERATPLKPRRHRRLMIEGCQRLQHHRPTNDCSAGASPPKQTTNEIVQGIRTTSHESTRLEHKGESFHQSNTDDRSQDTRRLWLSV